MHIIGEQFDEQFEQAVRKYLKKCMCLREGKCIGFASCSMSANQIPDLRNTFVGAVLSSKFGSDELMLLSPIADYMKQRLLVTLEE